MSAVSGFLAPPTPGELRVRLAAEPASVPGARRFVSEGLVSWGHHSLVEDAALCVTEMASNAALHSGSGFMNVLVHDLDRTVRICVEDEGAVPVHAVVPQMHHSPAANGGSHNVEDEPTTGRGLAIVSILASRWGVDQTDVGKRIWAEITTPGRENPVRRPQTSTVSDEPASGLPADWFSVVLRDCPVELSLRQDQHLDELIRELQLVDSDRAAPPSRALAEVIARLLQGPAFARHTGRRIAQDAHALGLVTIDVTMTVPGEVAAQVRQLNEAVAEADRLCEEEELLTLASPADLRLIRAWMTFSIDDQIENGAEPVSYADWLSTQPESASAGGAVSGPQHR
jgi:anti-sigma regulatory factor (Ser/Thr protein kinase)